MRHEYDNDGNVNNILEFSSLEPVHEELSLDEDLDKFLVEWKKELAENTTA